MTSQSAAALPGSDDNHASSAGGTQSVALRTGIWHNDRQIELAFPASWDVQTFWPATPEALTEDEIRQRIESPIGQPPVRELAQGKKRPCIVTDDLSRPTPVCRVMPFILEQFAEAGVSRADIRIVVGTGTHGHQDPHSIASKLGKEAVQCQIMIHDDLKNTKRIGKTSFGTPVFVNRDVLDCDLIIGVGGVYPQHTTGFGGGGKLALGILGRRSITGLHYTHLAVGGKYEIDNDFRRDVTEMARMIGLDTMYTLHINAHLEMVNLMCGDHYSYYPEAAAFSHDRFLAPVADDADVVIANAYPLDISFTFMRKAYKPLVAAPRSAMKIVIASAYEGVGHHGLFQHVRRPRTLSYRVLSLWLDEDEVDLVASLRVTGLSKKLLGRVRRKLFSRPKATPARRSTADGKVKAIPRNTDHLWVLHTDPTDAGMPDVDGMTILHDWNDVVEAIRQRHPDDHVKVRIYPCAPLQTFEN